MDMEDFLDSEKVMLGVFVKGPLDLGQGAVIKTLFFLDWSVLEFTYTLGKLLCILQNPTQAVISLR